MELEPRSTAPAHATGAVEFVPLADVSGDATFRLRGEGDVAALAASIGRLGQLAPIELRPLPGAQGGPRWQVVSGFRRLAAVRLLARERVLARVHAGLGDEDAWGIALGEALLSEPLLAGELEALRARLAESGAAPWAEELLPDALARTPVEPHLRERYLELLEGGGAAPEAAGMRVEPEGDVERAIEPDPGEADAAAAPAPEEAIEVTAEELAEDLAHRLYALNQDLALAAEAWAELPPEGRRMILAQLSYVARLLPHLEEREP